MQNQNLQENKMDFIKLITVGLLSMTLIQCSSQQKKEETSVPTAVLAAAVLSPICCH
jgi:hypothetical protein